MKRALLAALIALLPASAYAEQEFEVWTDYVRWGDQDETYLIFDYDGSYQNLRFGAEYTKANWDGGSEDWASFDVSWLSGGVIGPTLGVVLDDEGEYFSGGVAFEKKIGATIFKGQIVTDLNDIGDYVAVGVRTESRISDSIALFSNTHYVVTRDDDDYVRVTAGGRYYFTEEIFGRAGVSIGSSDGEELVGLTVSLGVRY